MARSVQWLHGWEDVAVLAGASLDRAAQPCLFDRLDWLREVSTRLLPSDRIAVAHARDDGGAVWLFLVERGRSAATSMQGWYSLAWGPVMSGNPDIAARLGDILRDGRRRHARLHLLPLALQEGDLVEQLLAASGWRTFRRRTSTNWTIDIAGAFAAYWAARPSQLRNTVKRQSRRYPLDIAIHTHVDDAIWHTYESVYAASWKPAEGSLDFLRALAEREAAAGTLRFGIAATPDGRPVAAQLWLVERGVATIHKLAHREDARHHSPGSILSHAMFRAAIDDDHVTRIDFGLGDEPYKADWMDTPNPVFRIDAYDIRSLSGAAGYAREIAGGLVRRLRHR